MKPMCEAAWSRRRSALNHDWLRNQLIQLVRSGVAFYSGEWEKEGFVDEFPGKLESLWLARKADLFRLAEDFDRVMSPRQCFAQVPLSRLPAAEREWLEPVVHELWVARQSRVSCSATTLYDLVDQADMAFCALRHVLVRVEPYAVVREKLAVFYRLCLALSTALSTFPTRILVS